MYNFLTIVLGMLTIPVLMVLITPFAVPVFFGIGVWALISLVIDLCKSKLIKKFN